MSITSLLFDHKKNRQLFVLAVPMILSNITIPLLGLIDTAVIGHLDQAYYLGGFALGSAVYSLIIWLLGFLRMSTTGLVAQAYGANDDATQQRLLAQSGLIAVILGIATIALQQPILNLALGLSDASDAVQLYTREYFEIRIWSTPFALLNLVLIGWLLGRKAPKAAMIQLIVANSINIVLDIVFVIGFNWQVKGAALASVIAEICAFFIAFVIVRKQLLLDKQFSIINFIKLCHFSGMSRLLMFNRDIFIRSLCLQASLSFMVFHGAGLGDNTVAANAVLLNLVMLISYALDGIAYYASAEVGSAFGKRNRTLMQSTVVLAFFWSAIVAIIFSSVFMLFGDTFIGLQTNIDAVRQTAMQYSFWLVLMPLFAFNCYLFDGVYIGAAQGAVMRNSMVLSTFGAFFPLWFVLQSYGNHALWAALSGFMLIRSVTLGGHYYWRLRHLPL
ncbi:MATE family efflux transporter [Shewanella intestini]|uniref:MATE family efflux transporter n=1 Tax=Shewanella intestini TaxID=2017544 RepID=A0ABS5I235_9GAMM|nr:MULTISPECIES: MATE family efflux transporter [Shewanella]MBR9728064.1 MATE family efflux transporter [Shewanella intestini]MRG36536.1 MATE family efflux transporter [Shewanella sp. XMDDZSB0408]